MYSTILETDLDDIIHHDLIPWDAMRNRCVFISGSTGLIGRGLVFAIDRANKKFNLGIKILAHARTLIKLDVFRDIQNIEYIVGDINELPADDRGVSFIFHCACITTSKTMVRQPVDVIHTSILGTMNVMEFAKANKALGVVFLSSMEVYGTGHDLKQVVTEKDLGTIDLQDIRSSYPMGKRMCENICYCYAHQYDISIKSARLSQTFGAGTSSEETRVFAEFARKAIAGDDIVLHTDGKSIGNYCYLADTIAALFIILLNGQLGETYNISNPENCMSIREMANILATEFNVSVQTIPMSNMGYANQSFYKMSTEKLNDLGWHPKYGIKDMYMRMIGDWDYYA